MKFKEVGRTYLMPGASGFTICVFEKKHIPVGARLYVMVPPVPKKKNVHTEHCCLYHGCKYGDEDCPVETGKQRQSYNCEACDEDH